MQCLTLSTTRALLVSLALLAGCSPPPVLTPVRIADRGIAPLARTAELRFSPTVYFEQHRESGENKMQLTFDRHDIAVRPNPFIAFAFSDAVTWVVPATVLWSPVVQRERGLWLTLGGGLYDFGIARDYFRLTNAAGIRAKRRFGSDFWLSAGLAALHTYNSYERESDHVRATSNFLSLIPGVEAGIQLGDAWAVTLLADTGFFLVGDAIGYSRLQTEFVFVPVWWMDIGVHGGIYLHPWEGLHVDPLVGFSITGRW